MSKAATLPLSRTPRGRESERMARKRSPWCMERKKERRGRERGQQPGTPAIRPVSPMLDGLVRCMYNGIPMRRGGGGNQPTRAVPCPVPCRPPETEAEGKRRENHPPRTTTDAPPVRPSAPREGTWMDPLVTIMHSSSNPNRTPPARRFCPTQYRHDNTCWLAAPGGTTGTTGTWTHYPGANRGAPTW